MEKSVKVFLETEALGQPSLPDEDTGAPRHSENHCRESGATEGIGRDPASRVLSAIPGKK